MLAWLMLPKVLLGIGGLVIVALIGGAFWALKRDLSSTQQKLEATEEKALKAAEEAGRNAEREENNRQELKAAIARTRQQNAANAARIREVEANATLAAMRAVKEFQDAADALLDPSTKVPIGPDALNEWQQQWKRRAGVEGTK